MHANSAPTRRVFLCALLSACCLLPAAFLQAADPSTFSVGELAFKRPATWQWVPVNSTMRKAQLKVPDPTDASKPGVDVVFFYFGEGQGGDIEGNVKRWIGQFSEEEDKLKAVVEAADVKGTKVTRVRVSSGTFSSGMPGGPTTPMTNYGPLRRDHRRPQGQRVHQNDRPADLVNAAAPNFEGMVLRSVLSYSPPTRPETFPPAPAGHCCSRLRGSP